MAEEKRQFRQRSPEVSIRDPIFSEPKALEEGQYEVNASVIVLMNNRPAYGLTYQFLVEGKEIGREQLVSEGGRASAKLTVSGKKPFISIFIKGRNIARQIPLREIEIPEEKKSKLRLEMLGTSKKGPVFTVILSRIKEKGEGVKGNIYYLDARPNSSLEPEMFRRMTNLFGFTAIDFELGDQKRKVIFWLPERPESKLELEIPAQQEIIVMSEPKKSPSSIFMEEYKKQRAKRRN